MSAVTDVRGHADPSKLTASLANVGLWFAVSLFLATRNSSSTSVPPVGQCRLSSRVVGHTLPLASTYETAGVQAAGRAKSTCGSPLAAGIRSELAKTLPPQVGRPTLRCADGHSENTQLSSGAMFGVATSQRNVACSLGRGAARLGSPSTATRAPRTRTSSMSPSGFNGSSQPAPANSENSQKYRNARVFTAHLSSPNSETAGAPSPPTCV